MIYEIDILIFIYVFYNLTISENHIYPTMSQKKMNRQIKHLEMLQLMILVHVESP